MTPTSLYLPISPCISLYLPVSPYISDCVRGLLCGSAYVLAQGGEVQWSFREAEIGDGFDVDEVVAAVHALEGIKTRTGQQPTTERP